MKKARTAIGKGAAVEAEAAAAQTSRVLDKTAAKGVFHRRKVARLKSRMAKKVNALKAKAAPQS